MGSRTRRHSLVPLATTSGMVITRSSSVAPGRAGDDRAECLMQAMVAGAAGDSSVVAELFTDDVHGWSASMSVASAAELAIELEDADDTFSDVELTFAPLDVGGDRACVEWEMRATHTGPLVIDDDVRIDATGVRLTLRGVTIAEFDGDRICGFRHYWDDAELLAQVGALPDH